MTPKQQAYKTLANTMIKNFAKRNIEAFYCETKEEARELIQYYEEITGRTFTA